MTTLTRQHFQAFADEINEQRILGLATVPPPRICPVQLAKRQAELASRVFARFNPAFDRDRFFKACGLESQQLAN